MKVYLGSILAGNSSAGPIEVGLSGAEIGDVVLGVISINGGPGGAWGPGRDFSASYAGEVTESSVVPGNPVVVQEQLIMNGAGQNFSNTIMVVLAQRGSLRD